MSNSKDGGPAFPVEVSGDGEGGIKGIQTGTSSGWEMGISVRMYLAAKAMQAFIHTLPSYKKGDEGTAVEDEIAKVSFGFADAFIRESQK